MPTPRCCHVSSIPPWNLYPGFEAQIREIGHWWFCGPNHQTAMSSVLHTRPPPLDTCHHHPRPAGQQVLMSPAWLICSLSWLSQHDHFHVHLHLSISQKTVTTDCQPASWSVGPNLKSVRHHSKSINTTRPYLTFSLSWTVAFELHTCTPQAKRYVTRSNSRHG